MAEDAAERVSRKAHQKIKKPAAAATTAGFFHNGCDTPESAATKIPGEKFNPDLEHTLKPPIHSRRLLVAVFQSQRSFLLLTLAMVTSGIASLEEVTVFMIAHAIKPRSVVIETPASARVLPPSAVPLSKRASLLHGYRP
jgi:hypothetical protein